MIPQQLEQALAHLDEIRTWTLSRHRFRGFSGVGRIAAGSLVVLAAVLMSMPWFPRLPQTHVLVWGAVGGVAFCINVVSLLAWYCSLEGEERHPSVLQPLWETLPPLFIGAVLTAALVIAKAYEPLFGMWMLMYGQVHLSTRHCLPPEIGRLGIFYIVCGLIALFLPGVTFLDPWPMAVVFFTGELIGGIIFHANRNGAV